MERNLERDLEILTAIGEGHPLTQRDLAERLGVALGLTNLYLKRLARKGFIKIADFPRKPAATEAPALPPDAAGHRREDPAHLRARRLLAEPLPARPADAARVAEPAARARGMKRIALYGTGEAAELAYLTLKELGSRARGGVLARGAGGRSWAFRFGGWLRSGDERSTAWWSRPSSRPKDTSPSSGHRRADGKAPHAPAPSARRRRGRDAAVTRARRSPPLRVAAPHLPGAALAGRAPARGHELSRHGAGRALPGADGAHPGPGPGRAGRGRRPAR